jgi:hypothetical protein
MKGKIRVFNKNINKEVMSIDEIFESKDADEAEIKRLNFTFSFFNTSYLLSELSTNN